MRLALERLALRIYRRLARAFPHEFRLAYGDEVTQIGDDVVPDIARRHGAAGVIRLFADIVMRLPIEYLSEMRQDTRYAMRALIKSPGFALVGIVSMGLAIGLTTNVYGSRWALLTREMPASNAKRLVMLEKPVSYFYIEQFRDQKKMFDGVAALLNGVPFNVSLYGPTDAKPNRVFGQLVSADYFSVLGVVPQSGRLLSAETDRPGDAPVVVISDRFWRNRLNSSPDAVGQTLRLNGQTATIVGITPKGFDGALFTHPSELFVPVTVSAALAPELANDVLHQRNMKEFAGLMCLAPGVTLESAEAGLDAIIRRLDKDDPSAPAQADKGKRAVLLPAATRVPIPRRLRPVVAGFFVVLMALIMTIACMNLATMLIARAANRRKELAIRLGVGASRFRLIRQMISEGILLSMLGGVAGFAFAYGLSLLNSQLQQPAGAPLATDIALDWRAAVFAFIVAILCGIGFSLAPALQATRTSIATSLKEGSALELPGHRRFGLRNVAVVVQLAGSLMLLLITGFLVIGLSKANNIETKFDAKTMILASIDPVRDGYTAEKAQALFEKLTVQLTASGGVRSVALAAQPPFSIEDEDDAVYVSAEDPGSATRVQKPAIEETVGAGYFSTLNESMQAGREFRASDYQAADLRATGLQPADHQSADHESGDHEAADQTSRIVDSKSDSFRGVALPAILNASSARGFFGNGNALGKHIRDDKQNYEVVGVVRDLNDGSGISQSIIYLPLTRRDFTHPPVGGITIIVRSDVGTDQLNSVRGMIASIDHNLTLFSVETLSESLARSRHVMWSALRTYGGIGLFGLILSAIGLAGVTAYAVAQRRKEIGIRMALGARKGQVLRLVLREGATLITIGTVLGFLGTFMMAKILSAMTNVIVEAFKIGTDDPRLLLGAPLLLAALALVACYLPARTAARINPLTALRQE